MVQVDYESLDLLLQARKISRRQLARLINISPDALGASFRRNSKMKEIQLCQIAHILSVQPTDLLATDENGNYFDGDNEKVDSEKIKYEFLSNDDEIEEIRRILEKLNSKGLDIIKTIAGLLSEISELKAQYSVQHQLLPEHEYRMSAEDLDALMNAEKEE